MRTDDDQPDLEYTVSCGKHDGCDPFKAQPQYGVFRTFEQAEDRARALHGRVMVRRVNDWAPASGQFVGGAS